MVGRLLLKGCEDPEWTGVSWVGWLAKLLNAYEGPPPSQLPSICCLLQGKQGLTLHAKGGMLLRPTKLKANPESL